MDRKTLKESLSNFLVSTQKYTGLDHAYFVKSGFWTYLTFLVMQSANLVLVLFLIRVLSRAQYGQYQFVLAVCAILGIFSIPQMKTPIMKFVADGHPSVLLGATYDRLKISLSGSLVSALLGGYYHLIAEDASLGNLFLVFGVLFPLVTSLDTSQAYMIGREQFGRRFRYLSVGQLFIKGGAIAALLIARQVAPVLVTTWVLTSVVNVISFLLVRRELLALEPGPKITDYGLKLTAISLIAIVAMQLDKLILAQYLGMEQLALFAVALLLPEQANAALKVSATLLAPRLKLVATKREILLKARRLTLPYAAAMLMVVSALLVLCDPLIRLLAPSYEDCIAYSQVLVLSLVLVIPNGVLYLYLSLKLDIQAMAKFTGVFYGLRIVGAMVLIPLYGIWGAVANILVTRAISLVLLIYME